MKKLILLLALVACCGTMGAQNIVDNVDANGKRTVFGKEITARDMTDRVVFNFSFFASVSSGEDTPRYDFVIRAVSNVGYKISKGDNLLLKNVDGDVIELKAATDADASLGSLHTTPTVYTDYSTPVFYEVTDEQMAKICKGILKVKMQTYTGAFEKEYKKDKCGKKLSSQLEEIKKVISKPKSFKDGF